MYIDVQKQWYLNTFKEFILFLMAKCHSLEVFSVAKYLL